MIKRILVLDDNQDVLDVLKEALSYEKYEVSVIANGLDVLETVRTFKPDLVILEYKLNGLDGDEICRQIKNDPSLNDIAVIICTAYLDNSINLLTCGCDSIIEKPFGLDELLDKVTGVIAA